MEDRNIPARFFRMKEEHPDRVLFMNKEEAKWRDISWGEVADITTEVANGLLSLGLNKGERVAILAENRIDWIYADLGILSAAGITVTIYPSNLPHEIEYIVNNSGSRFIIASTKEQYDKLADRAETMKGLEKIITLDDIGSPADDVLSMDKLREMGKEHARKEPDALKNAIASIAPEDLCTMVYTSGTTGPPKGAMISHGNVLFVYKGVEQVLDFDKENDMTLSILPYAHVYERIGGIFAGIFAGIKIALCEGLDKIAANVQEVRPTFILGAPRLYEKMYAAILNNIETSSPMKRKIAKWAMATGKEASSYRLAGKEMPAGLAIKYKIADKLVFSKMKERFGGRIKFFVSAAAPISKDIIEFFYSLDILIIEGWGMTETSAPSTINVPGKVKFGSVGQVLPEVDVYIADDGEVMVKGGNLFMGYWSPEGPIRDEFDEKGYFHTGDVGKMDEEGYLYITDRKKDIIITAGGKNIAPQNIENYMKTDRYISEALVFGDRKKFLSAILTLDEEALTEWASEQGISCKDFAELSQKPETYRMIEERIAALNKTLPKHETIKRFRILDRQFEQDKGEITPTMKLKRKALYEKFSDEFEGMYTGLSDGAI